MKAVNTIVKILTALAAIAGVVYVVATYGDKIVAWAKNLLGSCPCKCGKGDVTIVDDDAFDPAEEPIADAPEAPAEESTEVPVEENAVIANDADFEG